MALLASQNTSLIIRNRVCHRQHTSHRKPKLNTSKPPSPQPLSACLATRPSPGAKEALRRAREACLRAWQLTSWIKCLRVTTTMPSRWPDSRCPMLCDVTGDAAIRAGSGSEHLPVGVRPPLHPGPDLP
eukprot:1485310-Rhodomonas_salina.2